MPALSMPAWLLPIVLLICSNVFMTFAWYGHLRFTDKPLWMVIIASWMIAFFEYCLAVPANRFGSTVYNAAELKTMQEVITLVVFAGFSTLSRRSTYYQSCIRICFHRPWSFLHFQRSILMTTITLGDGQNNASKNGIDRPLDSLNFFLADVRDGLGPYLAIYLLSVQKWDELSIGLVMTVGGIAGIVAQTPAGALIDNSKHKKALIIFAAIAVTICSIALPWLTSFKQSP
jgi:uncharacterized protein (DUF486 family)